MFCHFSKILRALFVIVGSTVVIVGLTLFKSAGAPAAPVQTTTASPITHVVILIQENHSFDNTLGLLCLRLGRCVGPMTLADGTPIGFGRDPLTLAPITILLPKASNGVPPAPHDVQAQTTAIDGGNMDGFDLMREPNGQNCAGPDFACYQAFEPSQIPNLAALASNFVIADRTFQSDLAASWGSHLGFVAGTMDGFYGDNPVDHPALVDPTPLAQGISLGPGWGCDSNRDALWTLPSGQKMFEPSCVPFPDGHGTYLDALGKTSPVPWVPTLMDRLSSAGLSWKLYAGDDQLPTSAESSGFLANGYQWAICPTFADCLYTSQKSNLALASQVITDATNGTLPAVSIVTPTLTKSQHNFQLMSTGDNWIGDVVRAIENGPQWASTAIFITYDDCGCFYDHVPPPSGLGIRVPMVIVSPFAKRGHTDSNVASFASLLAFIEHNFGLRPLAKADAAAYDFSNSFNFSSQPDLSTIPMVTSLETLEDRQYLKEHPPDADDPT
jgi:phospholipase C